ncbi:CAP domain-containing protein [Alteribacillus sp. HJP-4]|uniref:CAP domain-containing protein n=1 Tax=Alteribacillus sp. HJP-4 TaxID=2775394 RepID=UPI0035CD2ECD
MKKLFLTLVFLLAFPTTVLGQSAEQDTYKVQAGDTLSEISEICGTSLTGLLDENPELKELFALLPGEHIEIPEEDADAAEGEEAPAEEEAAEPAEGQAEPEAPAEEETAEPAAEEETAEPAAEEEQAEAQPEEQEEADEASESQFEQEVIELTNQEREKEGLAPLESYSELSDVARTKSEDMRDAGYFDHNSPNYGSPFDMMQQFGIEYQGAGENIAAGQSSPEEVVDGWMNSPGHKENIMKSDFTHIGVGHAEGGSYGHYWTQMFVSK